MHYAKADLFIFKQSGSLSDFFSLSQFETNQMQRVFEVTLVMFLFNKKEY